MRIHHHEFSAVLEREPVALQYFVREAGPLLRRVITRQLRLSGLPTDIADDLLQDAWGGLFADDARALRAWDPGKGLTLGGYLCNFARYRTIDHLRVHGKNKKSSSTMPLSSNAPAVFQAPHRSWHGWKRWSTSSLPVPRMPSGTCFDVCSSRAGRPKKSSTIWGSVDVVYQRKRRLRQELMRIKEKLTRNLKED